MMVNHSLFSLLMTQTYLTLIYFAEMKSNLWRRTGLQVSRTLQILQNSRIKLCIVPSKDGKSSPIHVLENLEEEVEKYDLKQGDQLWIVIDTDRWIFETQIKPLLNARIKKFPVHTAVSNPCFELFLFLHFSPMPTTPVKDSRTMEKMLRSSLGQYSKSNLEEATYAPHIHNAIQEAEKTEYGSNSLPQNPGTDVGKLIKIILSKCPIRER